MKRDNVSVKDIIDSIVPITRFNRGEAGKIFDEVSESGFKVVLKNNSPACVLLEPEHYEAMVNALEDYALYFEAERRVKKNEYSDFVDSDKVFADLGINKADLDGVDVDID